jgi:hypothetical protein
MVEVVHRSGGSARWIKYTLRGDAQASMVTQRTRRETTSRVPMQEPLIEREPKSNRRPNQVGPKPSVERS